VVADFIPYSRQDVTAEDIEAVSLALRSEFLTQGALVPEFENRFARRHAAMHGIALSNATAGLHLVLLACGIGPGSRVWTSPISFVASANCALYCGATIDFVDIDPSTRNMSLSSLAAKLSAAKRRNELPSAVIPVDFAGLPADLKEMRELADEYGFWLIEDASHATGASYLGVPIGAQHAHASIFSFHAVKIITTGEGGMVLTNDGDISRRVRLLRSHGVTRDPQMMQGEPHGPWYYEQTSLGFNYRMTEIQAALGISQLVRLDEMHARRERLAARYDEALADEPVILPRRLADRRSAWHLYVIEIDAQRATRSRADVFERMRAAAIGVNVHYIPIHRQPFYARMGFEAHNFPASESYYARAISIPLFPAMSDCQQDRVIAALRNALRPS